MLRSISTIIIILITIVNSEEIKFKNCNWGISREDVKKIDPMTIICMERNNNLMYNGKFAGYETIIEYGFHNNKLCSGGIVFQIEHSMPDAYIDDYMHIRNLIIKKYGAPTDTITTWKTNSLFKNSPSHYGLAIATGELSFNTIWESGENSLFLFLTGDNHVIRLVASYINGPLFKQKTAAIAKKESDDF